MGPQLSDLWANDMWAMGVILVYLLSAHNTFDVSVEDGVDLVRKWRNDSGFQLNLACQKLAEWVRCPIQFVVIMVHVDSVASRGTAAGL